MRHELIEAPREATVSIGASPLPGGRPLRFDLAEIDVRWDSEIATLWSYMTPTGMACFSRSMLRDLRLWQDAVIENFAEPASGLKFLVLGSHVPGIFSLGGDLDTVLSLIRERNVDGLTDYAHLCTHILHRNLNALDLDIVTIGLLQGDAVGGGFETALSFDVLIAERQVTFSLPESAFGLFPGVGAHSILVRRLGASVADRMIQNGRSFTAEELHEMGLVHVLAEPGEGEQATATFIRENMKRHRGRVGASRASRRVNPIAIEELNQIARIWAETAVAMTEENMNVMQRLSLLQRRRSRVSAMRPA
jgi:DSF synthase